MPTLTFWKPIDQFRLLWWLCIDPARFVAQRNQVGGETTRKGVIWLVSTVIWLPPLIQVLGIGLSLMRGLEGLSSHILGIPFFYWIGIIPLFWLLTNLFARSNKGWALLVMVLLIDAAGFTTIDIAAGVMTGDDVMSVDRWRVVVIIAGFAVFLVGFGLLRVVAGSLADGAVEGLIGSYAGSYAMGGIVFDAVPLLRVLVVFVGCAVGIGVPLVLKNVLKRSLKSERATFLSRFILIALVFAYTVLIWASFLHR